MAGYFRAQSRVQEEPKMTQFARTLCRAAQVQIANGDYVLAIANLRAALRRTDNRQAWSKLMLAIRELSKLYN